MEHDGVTYIGGPTVADSHWDGTHISPCVRKLGPRHRRKSMLCHHKVTNKKQKLIFFFHHGHKATKSLGCCFFVAHMYLSRHASGQWRKQPNLNKNHILSPREKGDLPF